MSNIMQAKETIAFVGSINFDNLVKIKSNITVDTSYQNIIFDFSQSKFDDSSIIVLLLHIINIYSPFNKKPMFKNIPDEVFDLATASNLKLDDFKLQ